MLKPVNTKTRISLIFLETRKKMFFNCSLSKGREVFLSISLVNLHYVGGSLGFLVNSCLVIVSVCLLTYCEST